MEQRKGKQRPDIEQVGVLLRGWGSEAVWAEGAPGLTWKSLGHSRGPRGFGKVYAEQ